MLLEDLRVLVRSEGIKSSVAYKRWAKTSPVWVPSTPEQRYPEWTNWKNFLGTDNLDEFEKTYHNTLRTALLESGIAQFRKKKSGPRASILIDDMPYHTPTE